MTPRAIHQWKSFWLGVLVMASLGWAWWSSYGYVSYASYKGVGVSQQDGHVGFGYGGSSAISSSGHMRTKPKERINELVPLPFFARGEGKFPSGPYYVRTLTFKEEMVWSHSLASKENTSGGKGM